MGSDVYVPYSRRQRLADRANVPSPYSFDRIPKGLRHQVVHIWQRAIGERIHYTYQNSLRQNPMWEHLHRIIAEELELADLGHANAPFGVRCERFFIAATDDQALDIIEITFRSVDRVIRGLNETTRSVSKISQLPDHAIADLNRRFREHGIGYQFDGGEIIRVDSEFIHVEMVEPAIALLHHAQFKGASDEFMEAHEHYRHGRNKEAIREALNAFESTLKTICKGCGWQYDQDWPAKKLITKVLAEGLIPSSLQNQLSQFASLMEALPTVRNKMGGHGQGDEILDVPDYFAAHALHLAAANIVLLVEAYKALP